MEICLYYRAKIERSLCWKVTSTLRFSEHVVFDRCYDKENSIFEFFVPSELEDVFLHLMATFQKHNIVSELEKLPNRLADKS